MKKIFTSNYARQGQNSQSYGISYSSPNWFTGGRFRELAPEWWMVDASKKGELNNEEYARVYVELLTSRGLTPDSILSKLPDGAILLCYEAPNTFCHRRVLADWITQNTGVVIPEMLNQKEQVKQKQTELVDSLLEF